MEKTKVSRQSSKNLKKKLFIVAVIVVLAIFILLNFSLFNPRHEQVVSQETSMPTSEQKLPSRQPVPSAPPPQILPKHDDTLAYVINQLSNDVWLVNLDQGVAIAKIAVGMSPSHGFVDGNRLYVTNTKDNTISVIDINEDKVTQTIHTGRSPQGLVVKNNFLYVAELDEGRIEVIDKNTEEKVGHIPVNTPSFMAFNPEQDRIYVSNSLANEVAVIDPNINQIVKLIEVGQGPQGFIFDHTRSFLFVTNADSRDVSFVRQKTQREIQRVKTGITPKAVAIGEDDRTIFVANMDSSTVSAITVWQGKKIRDIDVDTPTSLAMVGQQLYAASLTKNEIVVIDPQTLKITRRVPVGLGPVSIVVKENL